MPIIIRILNTEIITQCWRSLCIFLTPTAVKYQFPTYDVPMPYARIPLQLQYCLLNLTSHMKFTRPLKTAVLLMREHKLRVFENNHGCRPVGYSVLPYGIKLTLGLK